MIEAVIDDIISWFVSFIERYSYLWEERYYVEMLYKFYPFDGNFRIFLAGVVYVVIVFLAVHPRGDEDDEGDSILEWFEFSPGKAILQFFRTMLAIGIINSSVNLCGKVFSTYAGSTPYNLPVNNMLSLLLLMLVIHSWYGKHRVRAFFFGIAVYVFPVFSGGVQLLFRRGWGDGGYELYVLEILIGAVVCVICCSMRFFYTAWIWCFILYAGFGEFVKFIIWKNRVDVTVLSSETTLFFLLVLIVSVFFERAIIYKKCKSA